MAGQKHVRMITAKIAMGCEVSPFRAGLAQEISRSGCAPEEGVVAETEGWAPLPEFRIQWV